MKYLTATLVGLLTMVPLFSHAQVSDVQTQYQNTLKQLIILLTQEIADLQDKLDNQAAPTDLSVQTVHTTQVTQSPMDQSEIIVHDDTQYGNNWPGQPTGRDYNIFLKGADGTFISTPPEDTSTPIEFWVDGVLVSTRYPKNKMPFDFTNQSVDPNFQPGISFQYDFPTPQSILEVKALGLTKVINIDQTP